MKNLGRILFLLLAAVPAVAADDWVRFRGPGGRGVSDSRRVAVSWSDDEQLAWKRELPGAGSSSPIVHGDRVFVTCYSGYGLEGPTGKSADLQRHVVCVDRRDGKILWTKTVPSTRRDDPFQGYLAEHGYASSTPVTDGKSVFAFFGKAGVFAYDFDGRELWRADVGSESSNRQWGSAASLVLYKNLLIVNAAEESQSIRAFDKQTGKEVWKAEGKALELAYGTPNLVTLPDGRTELVVAATGEVWGLDPDTGNLTWFVETNLTGNVCPSPLVVDDMIYVFGGFRSSGSYAIRAGGKDDVSQSHVQWFSRSSSYVATPVLHERHLYWIDDRGQAFCINAETGKEVYRERVTSLQSGGRPVYASPVLANGKIYVVSRRDGTLVLPAEPKFAVLAQNRFRSDESDFNATPAIVGDQMLLRSNRFLYCVANKDK